MTYSEKIKQLFQLGNVNSLSPKNKENIYDKFEFDNSDIWELIQLATDSSLLSKNADDAKNWAPVHAWHILARMKATEAIDKLIELFHKLEDNHQVDEELPEIFAQFGALALPSLEKYLKNTSHGDGARITAAACIKEIGKVNADVRKNCINLLIRQLEKFEENTPEYNSFLIWYLTDLGAKESFATIKEAFERNCVDETIIGDIGNVEYQLKLTDKKPQVQIFAEESFDEDDINKKN